jgi:hypothetical protein
MGRIAAATKSRDAVALREAAHKLCGTVSAFSPRTAETARRLEQTAADFHLDEAEALHARLASMLTQLTTMLDDLNVEELRARS